MSSILIDWTALDTNEFVFGIRNPGHPSEQLLFEYIDRLRVVVTRQVMIELHRNLRHDEQRIAFTLLQNALELSVDYDLPDESLVDRYKLMGLKKGDAAIAAQLEAANVRWLVSENRHFLSEVSGLPFAVLSAQDALVLLR